MGDHSDAVNNQADIISTEAEAGSVSTDNNILELGDQIQAVVLGSDDNPHPSEHHVAVESTTIDALESTSSINVLESTSTIDALESTSTVDALESTSTIDALESMSSLNLFDDLANTNGVEPENKPRFLPVMNPELGEIQPSRLRQRKKTPPQQKKASGPPKKFSGSSPTAKSPNGPKGAKAQKPKSRTSKPKPIVNLHGEKEYFVEKILGKKMLDGQLVYQVKWMGYDNKVNSWEPVENLERSMNLVVEYETSLRPSTDPTPKKNINEGLDHSFFANRLGPMYRHVWDPSEQPIIILGPGVYMNTLLFAVKIAPAGSRVEEKTLAEHIADVKSTNVVMVRASTMSHTFPALTIKYYESKINMVSQTKLPEEVAEVAARALILSKGFGDENCNLEQLTRDMMPEGTSDIGGEAVGPGTSSGVKAAVTRAKIQNAKRFAKEKSMEKVDIFGLPIELSDTSESSDEDEVEDEPAGPAVKKRLKRKAKASTFKKNELRQSTEPGQSENPKQNTDEDNISVGEIAHVSRLSDSDDE